MADEDRPISPLVLRPPSTIERPTKFLIPDIVPCKSVHLVVGASGSGKTTLTITEFVRNNLTGKPVFGRQVPPFRVHYISLDRNKVGVEDVLWRLGIPWAPGSVDGFSWEVVTKKLQPIELGRIAKAHGAKLLIIDGIEMCPPCEQNSSGFPSANEVSTWLTVLNGEVFTSDFVVVGIMQKGKERLGQQILDARHFGIGSIYWGARTETLLNISVLPDKKRVISVHNHMGPSLELTYMFNKEGELSLTEGVEEGQDKFLFAQCLTQGEIYTEAQLKKALIDGGYGKRATIYRNWVELLTGWKLKRWIETADSDHLTPSPDLYI